VQAFAASNCSCFIHCFEVLPFFTSSFGLAFSSVVFLGAEGVFASGLLFGFASLSASVTSPKIALKLYLR